MTRAIASLLVTSVIVALPIIAHAETPEELFDRGWDAMDKRDYETACALFDQSYARSRATGPLQGLAACYEARGLFRQAITLWRDAEKTLPPNSPSLFGVRAAIKRLKPRLAKLTLRLPAGAEKTTRVEIDGEVVEVGSPVEVDPAVNHVVTVTPPDELVRRYDLRLGEGEGKTMSLGVMRPSSIGPVDLGQDAPAAVGPVRATGIGLAALGLVGFAGAAITGGIMMAKEQTIDEGCNGPSHTDCDATAIAASEDAKDLAPWNIAAWIVGAAATSAGVTMIIVGDGSPSKPADTAKVNVSFTGLGATVYGTF
ncbi:MAG: hypothetical protein HOW73_07445 [Polyangiaceae bacterium]|nr:hypothetical protein [Polyangiaceae bacterium]